MFYLMNSIYCFNETVTRFENIHLEAAKNFTPQVFSKTTLRQVSYQSTAKTKATLELNNTMKTLGKKLNFTSNNQGNILGFISTSDCPNRKKSVSDQGLRSLLAIKTHWKIVITQQLRFELPYESTRIKLKTNFHREREEWFTIFYWPKLKFSSRTAY